MKNIMLLSLLAILAFGMSANRAFADGVECFSGRDSSRLVLAMISNQELTGIRFNFEGSLPRFVPTTKILNQSDLNQSTYLLAFSNKFVVADQILLTQFVGHLIIDGETYICR